MRRNWHRRRYLVCPRAFTPIRSVSDRRTIVDTKEDAKKWENKRKGEQSDPPRVGLSKLFPSGEYPEGEVFEYRDE